MVQPDLAARMHKAAALFRDGRLREAERAYRSVLSGAPDHADALYMLGSVALQAGRAKQALAILERAVRRNPLQPEFHVSLGNAQRALGRLSQAEASYRQALALRPDYGEVRMNLAYLLAESGRSEEAVAEYGAAIAVRPGTTAARLARARVLWGLGRAEAALADADAVLERDPLNAEARHIRAQVCLARGEENAAQLELHRALQADPRHAEALNDLGVLLERRGAAEEAEACYRRAVVAQPTFADALRNLARRLSVRREWRDAGRLWSRVLARRPQDAQALLGAAFCLQRIGKPKLAAARYEQYLAGRPDDAQALNNLASCRLAQGQHAAAEAGYRAVLARVPGHAEALHNLGRALLAQHRLDAAEPVLCEAWRRLGNAYAATSLGDLAREQGRAEEAAQWLRRALEIDPALERAEDSLGWVLATIGEFAEGWRLQRKARERDDVWRARIGRFPQPQWQGEPLAGKRLLVWAEQGLGDQIMFVSALRDVQAQAGHVVLEATAKLAPLFARSFPGVEVIAYRDWTPAPELLAANADLQCGMSAMAWFTRPGWSSFPAHSGYLRPDPPRVARWKERLAALGPGRRIGVSWRGGTEKTGLHRRSTALAEWLGVLRRQGAVFVSLQYGEVGAEIAALEREHGVRLPHWPEAAADMEEHAALIAALDQVITVCNTALHMAGALGVPVWGLVPARPGWRYLQRGSRMPWYPSARLFRQPAPGGWQAVFAEVERALDLGPV